MAFNLRNRNFLKAAGLLAEIQFLLDLSAQLKSQVRRNRRKPIRQEHRADLAKSVDPQYAAPLKWPLLIKGAQVSLRRSIRFANRRQES